MSKNFVKDPREVVKPGDIVRVKVLDVDVPHKRISLTLRLDDEAQPRTPGQRSAAGSGEGRRRQGPRPERGGQGGGGQRGGGQGGGRAAAPAANSAMADALRRAGLA
jgi:uncharacterized protein